MEYIKVKGKIPVYRHGEVLFVSVKSLPEGLKKADTKVIMLGSGNNPHTAKNCDLYFRVEGNFIFGYLKANKGNKIYHKEHGDKKSNGLMECSLKVGYYQLRRQVEETPSGMKPVID